MLRRAVMKTASERTSDHESGGKALILAQANLAGDGNAVNIRPASVPMTSAALPAIEALIQTAPGGHRGERTEHILLCSRIYPSRDIS
jgi:hypothetical protein